MKKSFVTLTSVTLIFLMVFTIHPQVAFADEGTPTSEETPPVEETPPPEETVEETEPTEVAEQPTAEGTGATSEVVSTPEQPKAQVETVETPDQNEIASEPSETPEDAKKSSVQEVLEQAPEGTQFVVLDENGQVESLASQAAADIVNTGDPMWCPGNTPPGGSGCTSSFATFDDLLNELQSATPGTYTGDGTIYVANTYDAGNTEPYDITIDGNVLTDLGALTIQGGWDGATGGSSANIIGTSTLNKSLEVVNWGGQVTINDVILSSTNYGLSINTTGSIALNNVDVTNTQNSDGISITSGGNVALTDVSSTSSDGSGATIKSGGDVSVQNSSFDDNGQGSSYGTGLDADATGKIVISNATASGNYEGGLLLNSGSSITLTNITASNSVGTASSYGVDATASGNITLSNVIADSNYGYGTVLASQGMVNIANSSFSGNLNYDGLNTIANGAITLNNVTASNNGSYGATLTTNGNVSVANSVFSGNTSAGYNVGLEIITPGNVQLDTVIANNNGNNGIEIYDSTNILLQNVTAQSNTWNGVYVEADCTYVETLGGSFSGNNLYGMDVATGKVKIKGSQFLNNTLGFLAVDDGGCYFIPARSPLFFSTPEAVLSWRIVSVSNDSPIDLDCTNYIGTILVLDNGDRIKLPCPILDSASLSRISLQNLPADLPDGYQYSNGIQANIVQDGISLDILSTAVVLSLQANTANTNLTLFYWDGSQWQDVASFGDQGGIVFGSDQLLFWNGSDWTATVPNSQRIVGKVGSMTPDGYFEAILNFTGIFVLAEKAN